MTNHQLQISFLLARFKNLKSTLAHQLNKPHSLLLTCSVLFITLHIQGQQGLQYSKTEKGNIATVAPYTNSNATATATVTLIRPISIARESDMEFGTIVLTGSDGKVTLDPEINSYSATGGVYLQSSTTTPRIAEFIVTGEAEHFYSLSVPSNITLSNSHGESLNLVLTLNKLSNRLNLSGSSIIRIGGTLFVPSNTVEGTYTNTTDLVVTVQYN